LSRVCKTHFILPSQKITGLSKIPPIGTVPYLGLRVICGQITFFFQYINELEYRINHPLIERKEKNMSVIFTGVTGLIGMALVRMLIESNEENVIAFHRNPAKRNLDDLKDRITINQNERVFLTSP
jgi:hypothetical protein